MSNFAAKLAGAATLALAALPVAALTTAAHAAPAQPVHVRIADLDLSTAAGRQVFDHRVADAGQAFCGEERSLERRAACMGAVRDEANAKLDRVLEARAQAATFVAAR